MMDEYLIGTIEWFCKGVMDVCSYSAIWFVLNTIMSIGSGL